MTKGKYKFRQTILLTPEQNQKLEMLMNMLGYSKKSEMIRYLINLALDALGKMSIDRQKDGE